LALFGWSSNIDKAFLVPESGQVNSYVQRFLYVRISEE
jgi:hypothetical protein